MYQDWMENVPIFGKIKKKCDCCYNDNPAIAVFCMYCGNKLTSMNNIEKLENIEKLLNSLKNNSNNKENTQCFYFDSRMLEEGDKF